MNPNKRSFSEDESEDELARRSRNQEFDYHPEPELMDECANQEAPSVPCLFEFTPTDQGHTVSSGYFSGVPSNLQDCIEDNLHRDAIAPMDISGSTTRFSLRRNVRFAEDMPTPAPKRFKPWDSSPSIKAVSRLKIEATAVSTEETEDFRPSLVRSATVPVPRPMHLELSDCPSLTSGIPLPVIPVARVTTQGSQLVSVDTVAQLVRGEYERRNITFTIIDCRFPYEYEAGHIRNAVNLYTSSDVVRGIFMNVPAVSPDDDENFINLGPLLRDLLSGENPDVQLPRIKSYIPINFSSDGDDSGNDDDILFEDSLGECEQFDSEPGLSTSVIPVEADLDARPAHVIIFHCEFSSQRGPALARFLRKLDRYLNYSRYPYLFFPHVFVMMGGYAAFYDKYPELCEPRNYLRMYQRGFRNQLRYYTKLSKEISIVCSECFRNSQFVSLKISPTMAKKEEKPALRAVKTMLLGSQIQKMEEFFEKSLANEGEISLESSVERNTINNQYLRLAEHIVRRGSYVTAMYERSRQPGMTSSAKDRDVLRDDWRYGNRSGPRVFTGPKPVALLTYSDDDVENIENRPPGAVFTGPRPRGKLSFSDCDDETPNNSNILLHL